MDKKNLIKFKIIDAEDLDLDDDEVSEEYSMERPDLGSRYKVKPGCNGHISDLLMNVAQVKADLISEAVVLDVIKSVFRENNLVLVEFSDRTETPFGLIYYLRKTPDGLKFWVTKQDLSIQHALLEACRELKELGYAAILQGSNILITGGVPVKDNHDPYIVASFVGGKVVSIKENQKHPLYIISFDGKLFCYSYTKDKLTIECSKGICVITAEFKLSDISNRKIANILSYQIKRYNKIFMPESFGLKSMISPIRHRKHALLSCGEGCVIVITPDDHVYLVTTRGQYDLCRPEGKISLDVNKSFKTINHVNTLNFTRGDIYDKFSSFLRNRGYFEV